MTEPTSAGTSPVLKAAGLTKEFRQGPALVKVLAGVDLTVTRGERIAIVGSSGSGKTTLLQLLGGLDLPTRGEVEIEGQAMHRLSDAARGHLRNRAVGFVYQFHHLLPEFSALENVAMPLLVRRVPAREALATATALLARVGLGERLTHRPAQLSGGERQRAAVARALVTRPALVLADEPTGNLDHKHAGEALALIREVCRENGAALLLVSHDEDVLGAFEQRRDFAEINAATKETA